MSYQSLRALEGKTLTRGGADAAWSTILAWQYARAADAAASPSEITIGLCVFKSFAPNVCES